jgi:hypothetical protein
MVMLGGILFQMGTGFCSSAGRLLTLINPAAITAFVGFALEFFIRFALHRPIHMSVPQASSSSTMELNPMGTQGDDVVEVDDTEVAKFKAGRRDRLELTRRLKLMISGLAVSTVLIFIRWVIFFLLHRTNFSTCLD